MSEPTRKLTRRERRAARPGQEQRSHKHNAHEEVLSDLGVGDRELKSVIDAVADFKSSIDNIFRIGAKKRKSADEDKALGNDSFAIPALAIRGVQA